MVKVYLGKTHNKTKIVKLKPKYSIKVGSTKHILFYGKGTETFAMPRKGVKLFKL